jgi:hypothetical protein
VQASSTDAEAQALRDQCALDCITPIQNVLAAYDGGPTVHEQKEIDDRAVDLWSPLVQTAGSRPEVDNVESGHGFEETLEMKFTDRLDLHEVFHCGQQTFGD